MKLLDIKNNLIKLSYTSDEDVSLASFLMLSAGKKSYVAQITTLKAQPVSNQAIAKLILVVNNDGILDNYDGSIPPLDANIVRLDSKELLNLLPVEKPIIFGEVAHEQKVLKLDESVFKRIERIPSILPQVKQVKTKVKYLDLSWEKVNYLKLE